ncbi:MAG: hypothetical protein R3F14_33815 [Polyangiaceae bacterium]
MVSGGFEPGGGAGLGDGLAPGMTTAQALYSAAQAAQASEIADDDTEDPNKPVLGLGASSGSAAGGATGAGGVSGAAAQGGVSGTGGLAGAGLAGAGAGALGTGMGAGTTGALGTGTDASATGGLGAGATGALGAGMTGGLGAGATGGLGAGATGALGAGMTGGLGAGATGALAAGATGGVGAEGVAATEGELPIEEYPIERCAGIAARMAHRPGERETVLEKAELSGGVWEALHKHWLAGIRAEAARGKNALLTKYDAAYVGALEEARGPITPAEHARLTILGERGREAEALAELDLPRGATMRIKRVYLARTVKDRALAAEVRAALKAASDAE